MVMGSLCEGHLGAVRVVAFTGRERDAPLGVWGAIAEQLEHIENLSEQAWHDINEHLGTEASQLSELVQQLGEKMPHWEQDAKAAAILAGALENDSV
jgi:hypothetical protein